MNTKPSKDASIIVLTAANTLLLGIVVFGGKLLIDRHFIGMDKIVTATEANRDATLANKGNVLLIKKDVTAITADIDEVKKDVSQLRRKTNGKIDNIEHTVEKIHHKSLQYWPELEEVYNRGRTK